ncbi:MAG: TIGR00730 family Rossman fold protein [Gloeobacteraceae cyanobacterium ES-bin-316]|nr:TIGR00730 family Rossman fold protein [Ferruginibacter sp.]
MGKLCLTMDKNKKLAETEIKFLEGPQSRWKEFKFTLGVLFDFVRGFRALHSVGPCVTIFGSARFKEDHIYYKKTEEIAGQIARLGFTIMTGGGPGIMEAANKGAREVGGRSVGCNIVLPHEQHYNPYLDKWVNINHFFVRKTLLIKYSYAFIVMPGGFGTLDEYFEALTLIQTKKIYEFPIIVFDVAYHKDLIEHIELMRQKGTISSEDLDLCLFTDSVDEAVKHLQEHSINKFGLKAAQKRLPSRWLFKD